MCCLSRAGRVSRCLNWIKPATHEEEQTARDYQKTKYVSWSLCKQIVELASDKKPSGFLPVYSVTGCHE